MNLPCWFSADDRAQAQALLNLGWRWLPSERVEDWRSLEHKIGKKFHGWQFWSTLGEVSLLASKDGAAFALGVEPTAFENELKKAKEAISKAIQQQEASKPIQLKLDL